MPDSRRTLVIDSSALISLSETCAIGALEYLKKESGVRYLAPQQVYQESVGTPSKIRKFGFSALRIKRLFDEGVVEVPQTPLQEQTRSAMECCNSLLAVEGRPLKLVHEGEAACIALLAAERAGFLAIDEKTTRLLVESPRKMLKILSTEYTSPVTENPQALARWQQASRGIKVIRSAEILACAASAGYFEGFGADEENALHAAVYALRNSGCSLSSRELAAYAQLKA